MKASTSVIQPERCRRTNRRRLATTGPITRAGTASSRDYSADGRRSRCAARVTSSTRSRALGAERLWELLHIEPYVHALGALTGNQAVQMVAAGLKAIYLSGWQVAADANIAGQMYPDQSLYPGRQRAGRGAPHQQRAPARRPDRARRRRGSDRD